MNHENIAVMAKGMLSFLYERLPDDLEDVALSLGREYLHLM
jgi:hypothetical protein